MSRVAYWRAWLLFAVKGGLSIALIAYLVRRVGTANIEAPLQQLSVIPIATSCLLLAAYFATGLLRWAFVLRALGRRIAARDLIEIGLVAQFFSQFLPSSVGADVLRIWQSAKAGLGVASSITSVLLERVTFLACLAVLVGFLFPVYFGGLFPKLFAVALSVVGIVTVTGAMLMALADRPRLGWLPASAEKAMRHLGKDARSFYRSPWCMAGAFGSFLLGQTAFAATLALLAGEFKIDVHPMAYLAIGSITILLAAVPVSIAGWGLREVVFVELLTRLGADASLALQLSVSVGMLSIVASLPGGLLWLWRRDQLRSTVPVRAVKPSEPGS